MKRIFLTVVLALMTTLNCQALTAQTVTVYTYSSFPVPLMEKIQTALRISDRLEVKFKSFSDTGPLFNQLLQERRSPQADLVVGLDNNYFQKAINLSLFQTYRPQALGKLQTNMLFDPKCRLLPFDYGYIVFNYDRTKLDRIPKTHRDLLDPYYRGKIIIENPLTSSPGQIFLLTTVALYGDPGYLDYWRKLKKNLLTIAPGWDEAYGMYTGGEAPIVLSYGTSPVYHYLNDKTERYQALVLDGAAYAQIEGLGLVKGAKHAAAARKVIDFMLSKEFQALIPENQFMYPVRNDVALPASFKVAAKVQRVLNLPQKQVQANLERWLAAWEENINK